MRTMKRILFALSVAMSLASCGAPAYAQQAQCGSAAEMVEKLEKEFHEIQIGGGIVGDQTIVVIYAAPDGSSWTALSMGTDGSACLIASGKDWFGGLPELPAPGEREA